MTTYTAIPNSELAVDAPARSINAIQLRDNPIAISEGAVGAPKIEQAALWVVVSGAVLVHDQGDASTTSTSYVTVADKRCWVTGTVKISLDQSANPGSSNTVFARVTLNGAQQVEWSTTSATPVARTIDVALVFGDQLNVQLRTDNVGVTSKADNVEYAADKLFILT